MQSCFHNTARPPIYAFLVPEKTVSLKNRNPKNPRICKAFGQNPRIWDPIQNRVYARSAHLKAAYLKDLLYKRKLEN